MNEANQEPLLPHVSSQESPHPCFLVLMILTGIAAISSASILIRLCMAPPVAIATYRVTLATLIISPYWVYRHSSRPPGWDTRVFSATLFSGVFLAFHFLFWIRSLALTSVASSASLVSSAPVFAALFAYCLLREKPARRLQLGIVCTALGSVLLAGHDSAFSQTALRGDLLAVLGAALAAAYLITGRIARVSLDLATYTLGTYGSAALILIVISFLTGTPLSGFSKETYLYLVSVALVPQLIGHSIFNWSLRFLSPTRVSVLILGEPIGATFLAYLFLGETLSFGKSIGLIVLISGILLGTLSMPSNPLRIDDR